MCMDRLVGKRQRAGATFSRIVPQLREIDNFESCEFSCEFQSQFIADRPRILIENEIFKAVIL